ncbi:Acid phosphatase/vanadium-dependent haloperoxidase-related protein [Thalictrum thalictroides]|uniref:Acid phosphatase/vanadium-dependent haloperoxidase-related protein n=1 Tax=Thalictrum thalictroides TaxID=46969 RepID=A0A7J6UTC1_THATH|nr:Acid phosphatase/vanadium-dependent haloperoxidase-related protein [Thalictrum thalictroides]
MSMEGGSIYSSSSSLYPSTSSTSSSSVLTNYALISSLLAFLLAQSAKFVISGYKDKRWDVKRLLGSGGMPSSHSATVTALAAATGFHDGFAGSLFAATMVLACVVMYDARGVRLHAGRQAEVLNQIVYELPAEHPLADTIPLIELLGHTLPQVVAGGILGIATAVIVHLIKIVIAKA